MKASGYKMHYNKRSFSGGNKLILTRPSPYIVERGYGATTGKYFSQGGING
jgi:hypothetical protein